MSYKGEISSEESERIRLALEKQMPTKLDKYILLKTDSNGLPTYGFCKKCGFSVVCKYNYCSNCGQAIDWSES